MSSMITEGHYRAIVENPKYAASTKQGTPCISATIRITEDCPHKGLRINWEGWMTDGAAKRTIQSMIYAGCTFPALPGEDEPNLEDFTGCGSQEVSVQVSIEEYTPEPTESNPNPKKINRPTVEFINPLGFSRTTKVIDDNQKKLVAKQFSGLAKQIFEDRSKGVQPGTEFDPSKMEPGSGSSEKKKKMY